jgi:hypothetical protein
MKQWDKTAGEFIEGQPYNDCFIADLRNPNPGEIFVFQKVDKEVQVIRINKQSKAFGDAIISGNIIKLETFVYDEGQYCCWNKGPKLEGELFYKWELENPEAPVLIFWDHDLGDVAVDSFELGKDHLGIIASERVSEDDYDIVVPDEVFITYIT